MRTAQHTLAMTTDVVTGQATRSLSDVVSEEIRAQLGRRRMSQAGLARTLHVSPSWVSLRLSGKQPIDLNDLADIADGLGVAVADLLPTGALNERRHRMPTTAYGLQRRIERDRPQTSDSRPSTYGAKSRPPVARPGAIQRRRGAAV